MKLQSLSLLAFITIFAVSCGQKNQFGETFDAEKAISAQSAYSTFINGGNADAIITGEILKVCQSEGCWFTYKLDSGDLFVDFGHKYNIPMNSAGRMIASKGTFVRDTTSVEQLKEYAKDEGVSEEELAKITEPEIRIDFIASGVQFKDK